MIDKIEVFKKFSIFSSKGVISTDSGPSRVLDISKYNISPESLNYDNWLKYAEDIGHPIVVMNQTSQQSDLDEYFELNNDGSILEFYRHPGENNESYKGRLTGFIRFINSGAPANEVGKYCKGDIF